MISSETKGKKKGKKGKAAVALTPFRLTARDVEILTALYECRALNSPQISLLLFPTPTYAEQKTHSRCLYRLKLLYEYGFVIRTEQPQYLSDGRKPFVYALAKKGAQVLCDLYDCELQELDWRARDNQENFSFPVHLRLTNDVRIAFIRAMRASSNVVIEQWTDEQALRRTHAKDFFMISAGEGKTKKATLVPDGYIRLHTTSTEGETHIYHHFLEIDRRTETVKSKMIGARDWSNKMSRYIAYYDSGLYEQRYAAKGLRVLTVTTGQERLANLKQKTEGVGGKSRFWFTTFDLVATRNILTDPIWQVAGKEGERSLLWE